MIKHLEVQAELGFRFLLGHPKEGIDGSYRLYCNEVLQGTNTIFVRMDDRVILYLTYNVINLLVTENPRICGQVETSLRNLSRKSTLISSTSEKERHKFFNGLYLKINNLRAKTLS
jgi:hypothetical protein